MNPGLDAIVLGVALLSIASGCSADTGSGRVTVRIMPSNTRPISPYIYGVNSAATLEGLPQDLTLDRAGGNRWTAYNWESNASNAGSDYYYQNDTFLSGSSTPAEAVTSWISGDQKRGAATLITVQMQGWVAADVNGRVSIEHPPEPARFKKVIFQKKMLSDAPFTVAPPKEEPAVYMDEFIWAVDHKFPGQNIFGKSPSTQPVFAQLDNEPELWKNTHREVQGPNGVPADTYIAKTIALATALKTQFPDLVIFGPAHFGFYGIYTWNGELSPSPNGGNWFPDRYLPALKAAAERFGKPLVDVYDFHWYPEVTDGNGTRITKLNGATLSDDQVQAIVQSARSLWDKGFREKSWITQTLGGPVDILPRLQSRIDAQNPGMRLAITEYNPGGGHHIAGTLAEADYLGVFGTQGLFAANFWPLEKVEPYTLAGFRAFRDFDGARHNFGDTSVQAESSNIGAVAAYVSTDSTRPGRVVIVAINRSAAAQETELVGQPLTGTAHLFRMSATSAAGERTIQPVAAGTQSVSGSSLQVSLPALSVTTIDIY
jgi:hypothetical protein